MALSVLPPHWSTHSLISSSSMSGKRAATSRHVSAAMRVCVSADSFFLFDYLYELLWQYTNDDNEVAENEMGMWLKRRKKEERLTKTDVEKRLFDTGISVKVIST